MNRRKNIGTKMKDESGAVAIVEATIVFPVMFFVLFFILLLGNVYYQQARVDNIVAKYAVKGANRVVNPLQVQLDKKGGKLPTDPESVDVQPYRYIFGTMNDVEDQIAKEVYEEITKKGLIIWAGNRPEIRKDQVHVKYNNYVLFSNFEVEASYQIKFPIKFIGSDDPIIFKASARSQVAINDVPEFVRNVDMTVDMFEGTEADKKIKNAFDKVNEFINSFS